MTRNPIPQELPVESVVAIVDSREQCPLTLAPLAIDVGTLTTGDYSIKGLENVIAIERKSLDDFVACCGNERERFEREVMRLLAYPTRAVVIEADWLDLERGQWRSRIKPQCVTGSAIGWIGAGLPIVCAHDHFTSGKFVSRLLYSAARKRWREARALLAGPDPKAAVPLSRNAVRPETIGSFCLPVGEGAA